MFVFPKLLMLYLCSQGVMLIILITVQFSARHDTPDEAGIVFSQPVSQSVYKEQWIPWELL